MSFADFEPLAARITSVTPESADTRTFVLSLGSGASRFDGARPGQFLMLSVLGHGEAAFSFSALARGAVVITVREIGSLTSALFALSPGAQVWLRGPFGHGFPAAPAEPTLYVAGGCGLSPLKAAIEAQLMSRPERTPIAIVYGARSPEARIHRDALASWRALPDVLVIDCVERDAGASDRVGSVVDFIAEACASTNPRRALVGGPDAMLRRVGEGLVGIGMDPRRLHFALERVMKCGTGECGHCYVDNRYVCKDGPVFSYAELRELRDAFREAPGVPSVLVC